MLQLPVYISVVFGVTALLTVWLFSKAIPGAKETIVILLTWLSVQAAVSLFGFYTVTKTVPPRFLLLVFPPLLLIIILFIHPKGRLFLDSLRLKNLIFLHVVRIPVELVLLWLSFYKAVPQLMTFEGRNFDILSGLTASFIYYFGFIKKRFSQRFILIWNLICLGLLLNIVIHAVLSAPFTFQQLAFDQPNIALLYFPFTWLPCCIVPIVLLAHLAAIRQLIKNNKEELSVSK